jgi:hypothetical protein
MPAAAALHFGSHKQAGCTAGRENEGTPVLPDDEMQLGDPPSAANPRTAKKGAETTKVARHAVDRDDLINAFPADDGAVPGKVQMTGAG